MLAPLIKSNMIENDGKVSRSTQKPAVGLIVLFAVILLYGYAIALAYYLVNEYANKAIRNLYFPNATHNSTTHSKGCGQNANSTSEAEKHIENFVQEKLSQWSIYISLASGIPSLVSTTMFGSLSDTYGRKKMLFISLFGSFCKLLSYSCAIYFNISIYYYIAGCVLEGCTGGWIAVLSIAFAYVADVTEVGNTRAIAIAAFEMILNVGYSTGVLSSGFLIKHFDNYLHPMILSTGAVSAAILASLFLPETVRVTKNKTENKKRIINQLSESAKLFTMKSNQRSLYLLCMFSILPLLMAKLGSTTILLYYILGSPICFNPVDISLYVTTKGILSQLVTLAVIKAFQFCMRDEYTAVTSAAIGIVYYIIIGFTRSTTTLFIAGAVGAFSFACIPLLRSSLSKITPEDKQGSIFGALALVENICNMVGSVSAGAIYSATVTFYKGFAFFVSAFYMLISAITLTLLALKMDPQKMKGYEIIQ